MRWHKSSINSEEVKQLTQYYKMTTLQAAICIRRNIIDGKQLCYYLEQDINYLHNPFTLRGMEDAVDRILQSGEEQEKVLVFGDRDVDGIASIVLMVECLKEIGSDVQWSLPLHDENYGLHTKIIETFAAEGGTLIIAVDCGTTNYEALYRAQELGVDTIVFDHHALQDPEPPVTVLVNPASKNSGYPLQGICTTTIVMKFTEALAFAQSEWYKQTICLMNLRPGNDCVFIDTLLLRNLVEIERNCEALVPGITQLEDSKVYRNLQGIPIFVFDSETQKQILQQNITGNVEIYLQDIAPTLRKIYPDFAGKPFLQIQENSSFRRYNSSAGEIDMLCFLFRAYHAAIEPAPRKALYSTIDLAAVATLADMMPLEDENRLIVRLGLKEMNKKMRSGLQQLYSLLNLSNKPCSHDISWYIAPVINASGRMGRPDKAVELLLSGNADKKLLLAEELIALNEQRKKIAAGAWNIVIQEAKQQAAAYHGKLIVVYNPGIHRGVTGIIAGRLARTFHLPAIIITKIHERCVGSVRAGGNFNANSFLKHFESLFTGWGGHAKAAGFSLLQSDVDTFIQRLQQYSRYMELSPVPEEVLSIDAELPAQWLQPNIIDLVHFFEPYGMQTPALHFLSRDMRIESIAIIGKNEKHFKFMLRYGVYCWPAIHWNAAQMPFKAGDRVDVVFEIMNENYYSQDRITLNIIGMLHAV